MKTCLTWFSFLMMVWASGQLKTQENPIDSKAYEAVSLFGQLLTSPPPTATSLENLEKATKDYGVDKSEANTVAYGRALVASGRVRDAIAAYSVGLAQFPDSIALLRHRGHRYLSIRQFGRAIADFEQATRLLEKRTPSPELFFDLYYHYGLACYLSQDYAKAENLYRTCLKRATDDESRIAISDWLYLTLRQSGQNPAASKILQRIRPTPNAGESQVYLERLLMFKGDLSETDFAKGTAPTPTAQAIRLYGLGLSALWRGERQQAIAHFSALTGDQVWMGFATLAAEVELAKLISAAPTTSTLKETLQAWVLGWNVYDLDLMKRLFRNSTELSYFSSEKAGRIDGFEALLEHHRGFGFTPGGKVADNRLWLSQVQTRESPQSALITAIWHFDRDVAGTGQVQRGPVTFFLTLGEQGWQISHAHFANDPAK